MHTNHSCKTITGKQVVLLLKHSWWVFSSLIQLTLAHGYKYKALGDNLTC